MEGKVAFLGSQVRAAYRIPLYRFAYAQARLGFSVKRDMPQLVGAEVERLYADGASWLAGLALPR